MLLRGFFHQIEKQEEMSLYLLGPTLSGPFVCCNFMHYLLQSLLQYLNL